MNRASAPFPDPIPAGEALQLGISSCLLGEDVRWNSGHKRDRYLTDVLGEYVEFVPVCPEDQVMGTPRPRVRLVGDPEQPRMKESESGRDWTERMKDFINERVNQLREQSLDGYVLKKNSPTCGMETVHVYKSNGDPNGEGAGLFARRLMDKLPLLPVEEEGRLNDPGLRENFIERIFSYRRWKTFRADDPTPADFQQFHRRHKLSLMAHHQEDARELGQIVAGEGEYGTTDREERLNRYGERFMSVLEGPAPRSKHTNVLQHMMGYLRDVLNPADRRELLDFIEQYREGQVPLIVPITLFKHHFRRHPVDWIVEQTYLNPYPSELMLRNRV